LTSYPLVEDACVRGYTLSLLLAIQPDICLAGLLPKGDTLPPERCSRRPVATLLLCKSRQSKRPSSIHFVQSRNCDNLLSSLFIYVMKILKSKNYTLLVLGLNASIPPPRYYWLVQSWTFIRSPPSPPLTTPLILHISTLSSLTTVPPPPSLSVKCLPSSQNLLLILIHPTCEDRWLSFEGIEPSDC
jgi:hypothetical protein